jgi:hypothetical protein
VDTGLLRGHHCVPVAILDDLCVLAVGERDAQEAVRVVRAALRRDILPVLASSQAIRDGLARLGGPPRASHVGAIRAKVSPAQARFRRQVLGGEVLDALPIGGAS